MRRQGREVPGESRPPERGVPGTGQLGACAGRPHRPLEETAAAAATSSAPGVPARGLADLELLSRCPQAVQLRAVLSPRRFGRARWRTPPAQGEQPYKPRGPGPRRLLPLWVTSFARCQGSAQQRAGAGGQRGSGYARGARLRRKEPDRVAEPAAISTPAPSVGGGGRQAAATERMKRADQTFREGVPT